MYHHDKPYMKKLQAKSLASPPYGFHMCWTQGKPDKLKYLKIANMWYLTPQCSALEDFILDKSGKVGKAGAVYRQVRDYYRDPLIASKGGDIAKKQSYLWDKLGSTCCQIAY